MAKRADRDVFRVTLNIPAAGAQKAIQFFIADEPVKVIEVSEIHETAESTAGSLTAQVERCQATEAIGAGDSLLGSGIDLKGTGNTVVTPALTGTTANLSLSRGDRLGWNPDATGTEIAGVNVTVTLERE